MGRRKKKTNPEGDLNEEVANEGNNRRLRKTRQTSPKVKEYMESIKRGRGRPRKTPYVATVGPPNSEDNEVVVDDSNDGNDNRVIQENGASLVVTIDNSGPPNLMRQPMNIDERANNEVNGQTSREDPMPSMSSITPMTRLLPLGCGKYLKGCEELTQRIDREGINKMTLVTALKYYLVKSNLGDIDHSINDLKLAAEEMTVGTAYNIENICDVSQPNERHNERPLERRGQWEGCSNYTPQPNYEH